MWCRMRGRAAPARFGNARCEIWKPQPTRWAADEVLSRRKHAVRPLALDPLHRHEGAPNAFRPAVITIARSIVPQKRRCLASAGIAPPVPARYVAHGRVRGRDRGATRVALRVVGRDDLVVALASRSQSCSASIASTRSRRSSAIAAVVAGVIVARAQRAGVDLGLVHRARARRGVPRARVGCVAAALSELAAASRLRTARASVDR